MKIATTLRPTARPMLAATATGILFMLLAVPPADAHKGSHKAKKDPIPCGELATRYQALGVVITSSTPVDEVTTGGNAAPEHCDVRGTISDNIKFALFLPTAWNERFQMVGNGGKAGSISLPAMRTALRLGYASSSTDTGHDNAIPEEGGARFGNDALFGKEREIDFGWRAVHLTARISKDIIAAHYADKPRYSYWNGCSTGGRQGLMEAQRFPDDFDGYLVGAPVYNYTGQQMAAPAYLRPLYSKIPPAGPADGPVLSPAKRDMVGNVIYNGLGDFKGCDVLDGVVDGQIRNPLKCDFDPAKHIPACSDTSGPTCLTPSELTALQEIYAGKEPFVPGMPFGLENIPGGWSSWVLPNSPTGVPLLHGVIADAFEWLMFDPDRPGFDYLMEWNWNVEPFQMKNAERIYNATDPNLLDVMLRGKKILMYHGWGDPAANAVRSIRYRESVVDSLADKLHLKRRLNFVAENLTDRFLKLYLVPGMAHCGGGVGHSTVDWFSPLVDWVEHHRAPKEIIGTRDTSTGPSTRPHCPYPQEAVWTGAGSTDDAANFVCKRVHDH